MTIDAEFAKWLVMAFVVMFGIQAWAFYAFAVLFVTGRKLLERQEQDGPRGVVVGHGRHV